MPDRPLAFRDHRRGAHLPAKASVSRPCSQNTDPALNTQHSFPSETPRHCRNSLKHWEINIRNISLLSTPENKSLPVTTGLFFTIFSPLPRLRKWQDAGKRIRSLSSLLFDCLRRRLVQLATCSCWKRANSKGKGWVPRYSLRMELVQGPVYSNSNLQVLHTSVFSLLLYNSCQSRPTELGSSPGNSSTHFFHNDAVLTRAVQAKLLQNSTHLEEGEPVAA